MCDVCATTQNPSGISSITRVSWKVTEVLAPFPLADVSFQPLQPHVAATFTFGSTAPTCRTHDLLPSSAWHVTTASWMVLQEPPQCAGGAGEPMEASSRMDELRRPL